MSDSFQPRWTVAYQAPPSMGFSKQEYWSGLPFPPPGDLPNSGIEPRSPALEADPLTSEPPGKPQTSKLSLIKKHVIHMGKDKLHEYTYIFKAINLYIFYKPGLFQ